MSEIRLVALDLDGTVFNDEKQISPRTLKAIRAALDKGVDVLPATGRTVDGVPRQFLEIPGVRYALTSNGASVVDLQTGERLVSLTFDPAMAAKAFDVVQPFGGLLSVFIHGVSKGPGLMALARHLGLAPAQVMAVGDSGNDRTMVQLAGLGVAMGNATEDIRRVADAITADNNHDGVAEAIEKYVL